ncbi:hypothetical protein LSH36_748g00004 [Paralvinella palmiformis]|uniref:Uncharacterized protein n=1 Tax=Paralvinella palmiformis TaxID=53620 RepID=A0AAD9MT67_9ANNE|nr:hypothetical protein LSH36_748g00004 [Paralvinella palmiformis]
MDEVRTSLALYKTGLDEPKGEDSGIASREETRRHGRLCPAESGNQTSASSHSTPKPTTEMSDVHCGLSFTARTAEKRANGRPSQRANTRFCRNHQIIDGSTQTAAADSDTGSVMSTGQLSIRYPPMLKDNAAPSDRCKLVIKGTHPLTGARSSRRHIDEYGKKKYGLGIADETPSTGHNKPLISLPKVIPTCHGGDETAMFSYRVNRDCIGEKGWKELGMRTMKSEEGDPVQILEIAANRRLKEAKTNESKDINNRLHRWTRTSLRYARSGILFQRSI